MIVRPNRYLLLTASFLLPLCADAATVIENGKPRMTIRAGSVAEPVAELKHYLESMSGAKMNVEAARAGAAGLYVGLAKDFPWFRVEGIDKLGKEGFLVGSDDKNIFLLAHEPRGVSHAVVSFLSSLGCRWYFPGKVWEVVPQRKTIAGSWNEKSSPCFPLQRKIWYGFGSNGKCRRDLDDWERHNRMGGPVRISIGHSWIGLDPKRDFTTHPDWFALVNGKRQPSKPCYSNPEVVRKAMQYALEQAAKGATMISLTPPDGLGYCECERCRAVCRGGEPYQSKGATFARRPDGVLINVTSETLFHLVNRVAAEVSKKYPKTLVGCYAYSAYSHPPSFKLHPNVFLQTTTAFRRTPLSLAEQLEAFHKIGVQSGIRAYFSVYQWDWDFPTIDKGDLMLPRLVDDLRFYHRHNVQSINGESSCNWAPRGLGYYLAARLMWNVDEDPKALLADFYDKAFGPAAAPMERYYVRWLGSGAAVKETAKKGEDGSAVKFTLESLKAAYLDLDDAARRVKEQPQYRARVDQLRLYAHYLYLRTRLDEAVQTHDKDKILAAIKNETIFGARLQDTNMIHSRPLLGKAFHRRFRSYKRYLEGTPEWPQGQKNSAVKAAGKGYRRPRSDVPDRAELEKLWKEDKKTLEIR